MPGRVFEKVVEYVEDGRSICVDAEIIADIEGYRLALAIAEVDQRLQCIAELKSTVVLPVSSQITEPLQLVGEQRSDVFSLVGR